MVLLKIAASARNAFVQWRYASRGSGLVKLAMSRKDALAAWPLMQPYEGKTLQTAHRVVSMPHIRNRAHPETFAFTEIQKEWYRQRAGYAFTITEALQASKDHFFGQRCNGLWSDEQEAQLRDMGKVIGEEERRRTVVQLTVTGPAAHEGTKRITASGVDLHNTPPPGYNEQTIALADAALRKVPLHVASLREIQEVIAAFRAAARRVVRAGFEAVDVPLLPGSVLDNFARSTYNKRTDAYGGSVGNRMRLLDEVLAAVIEELGGAEKVGVSFYLGFDQMGHCDSVEKDGPLLEGMAILAERLGLRHVVVWDRTVAHDAPATETFQKLKENRTRFLKRIREQYSGPLVVSGFASSIDLAARTLADGICDFTGFSTLPIAHPDLPRRLLHGANLHPGNAQLQAVGADYNTQGAFVDDATDAKYYIDWRLADLPPDSEAPKLVDDK